MLVATRILASLFALIALGTGFKDVFLGLVDVDAAAVVDNTFRYYAGIWAAVGLGLVWCVVRIRESTQLFRFLLIAIFIGGIARAIGLLDVPLERPIAVGIAIETILPVVLWFMQSRIQETTAPSATAATVS